MPFGRHLVGILAISAATSAASAPLPLAVDGGGNVQAGWSYVVASPGDDWINDLVLLSNGNLLGVGFVNRRDGSPPSDWAAVAVELRTDGTAIADRRYGEGSGIDAFWSAMEGAGGARLFAGFTTRIGKGGINAFALSTVPGGDSVEKAFGGDGYDRFTDITQAGDGFALVGHSQLPSSDLRRVFLVKTDGRGELVWERVFGGPESWGALYVEPSGDCGFIIAGGVSASDADGDMFALKVDSSGRELWRKRIGTPDWDEINHGLVVRADGTIVLVGYTHAHGAQSNDLVAATLSPKGDLIRLERLGGSGDDRAINARLDGSRVWIVGHTVSAGAGGADMLITSLDADGAFEPGAVVIGGPRDDHGTAIQPLSDGSLAVAGYSRNLGVGEEDALIARLTRPDVSIPHPAFKRTQVTPIR